MKILNSKIKNLDLGLIWFGAAISIAEILTGTLFAPLGFSQGILAIVIGHLIGCGLFFLVGLIGAKSEKTAMESVKIAFGEKGAIIFTFLNILQLIGWTAVMISQGAGASSEVFSSNSTNMWSIIIGILIIIWILIGIKNLEKINIISMSVLFILTLILSFNIFKGTSFEKTGGLSFGQAIELSIAMPLSWLPLIGDYTKDAKNPFEGTLTASLVYFFASIWMYIIGMSAAGFSGSSSISQIMLKAGLGSIALIIVIFSTVTTTFLDAYSGGVSCKSLFKNISEKWAALIVTIIGIALAIFFDTGQFENFLYLIGSVFAPMASVQIVDYFLIKNKKINSDFDFINIISWVIGFIIYRIFLKAGLSIGATLPAILITGLVTFILKKFFK